MLNIFNVSRSPDTLRSVLHIENYKTVYILFVIIYIHTVISLSKPSQGKKHKHMSLSLNDKLCVIEKF